MSKIKSFEDTVREDLQSQLLFRSRRFSSLYFWSLIVNTAVGTIACVLLLMGQNQESIIFTVTGFGSTAIIKMSGKESNRSLNVLIDYLQND